MNRSLAWLCATLLTTMLSACAHDAGSPTSPGTSPSDNTLLDAYHWRLQQATDSAGTVQDPGKALGGGHQGLFTLTFQQARLSVTGLCNVLSAGYATQGKSMAISQVVSTMRACGDPALMQYETAVARQLPGVSTWKIIGADLAHPAQSPTLILGFKDGGLWRLAGEATPETIYGSAGERIFMEVAAQTVPCNHPLIQGGQCLRTRTVTYDQSGLKQGYGPWEVFHENIAGYTHEAGVRNVLRLKRYTRKHVPADASRYAYVLDMTVESERTSGK